MIFRQIGFEAQIVKAFARRAGVEIDGQRQGFDDQVGQIGLVALEMIGDLVAVVAREIMRSMKTQSSVAYRHCMISRKPFSSVVIVLC